MTTPREPAAHPGSRRRRVVRFVDAFFRALLVLSVLILLLLIFSPQVLANGELLMGVVLVLSLGFVAYRSRQ